MTHSQRSGISSLAVHWMHDFRQGRYSLSDSIPTTTGRGHQPSPSHSTVGLNGVMRIMCTAAKVAWLTQGLPLLLSRQATHPTTWPGYSQNASSPGTFSYTPGSATNCRGHSWTLPATRTALPPVPQHSEGLYLQLGPELPT